MQVNVSGINKAYSTVQAVRDLSFQVNSGEIFAMLGPNGAGKSSTIRMLINLTGADSGDISFTSSTGMVYRHLQSKDFGYLPEDRGLFQETSIIKTLVYMGQLKDMSKSDAMEAAQDWLTRFDLIDRKDDALKTLSKGNQQKVQLISAIIHTPAIAFLDEPFSGLDPINQEKVIEFLAELKSKGTTILLSAHQMSLVEKLADRFLLMNQGQGSLYGDIEGIRAQSKLGNSVHLGFEQPISSKEFGDHEGVLRCDQVSDKQVTLHLKSDTTIPDLLQNVFASHRVANLSTTQPSLHDIYLNNLQGGK